MIIRFVFVVALIAANGFFVAAEFAFVATRQSRIDELAREGAKSARVLQRSVRNLSFALAGAQFGITIASLLLGFVAEPVVSELIVSAIGGVVTIPNDVLHAISFIAALAIVVFLHMVFGEMAPKNFAITEPDRTALTLAIPFRIFTSIFSVVITGLNAAANVGVRLLGVDPADMTRSVHSSEEITAMLRESRQVGAIVELEDRMLRGALSFRERDAGEVMTPRTDMAACDLFTTPDEIESVIRETGFSRIPIYQGDPDDVIGFVHAKDLFDIDDDARSNSIARSLVRDPWVVPEHATLLPILADMRRERRQFAIVVDEHGATAGVLTLEDILEELVGEIRDEYDLPDSKLQRLSPTRFLADGAIRPDELVDSLSLDLPDGEYDTLAGFLLFEFGDIPTVGQMLRYRGWSMCVREMDGHRIARVELVSPEPVFDTGPRRRP